MLLLRLRAGLLVISWWLASWFVLGWVGTNGNINYLSSFFFSQSLHGYSLVCSLLFLENQFSRVSCLVAQLLWHLLGWAGSAGSCLSLTAGWPHVFHCWKWSCCVWLLLSLKQYCIGNVNGNSLQTFQLKTKPKTVFKDELLPTQPEYLACEAAKKKNH